MGSSPFLLLSLTVRLIDKHKQLLRKFTRPHNVVRPDAKDKVARLERDLKAQLRPLIQVDELVVSSQHALPHLQHVEGHGVQVCALTPPFESDAVVATRQSAVC